MGVGFRRYGKELPKKPLSLGFNDRHSVLHSLLKGRHSENDQPVLTKCGKEEANDFIADARSGQSWDERCAEEAGY